MADKETGFEISVSASADKGSAKKAVNDLGKEVTNSLKDGYIEVPVEPKASVKGVQKELSKAQKDVAREWQKTSRKGFSSSKDNLDIKRRLKNGIKAVLPKGYKRSLGWNEGVATTKSLLDSEFGAHPSGFARQMRISQLAARKWEKESLRVRTNKEEANRLANTAIAKNPTKRQVGLKNSNLELSEIASKKLASIIGSLEANKPEDSIELFDKYLKGAMELNQLGGRTDWESIRNSLNASFGRYFNTTGAIGSTDGRQKGVGPGHANAQEALIGMFKIFEKALEKSGLETELARVRKILADINVDAVKDLERTLTLTSTERKRKGENSLLERKINELNKTEQEQNRLDTIEHSAERVADTREEQLSASIEDIEKVDATDGMNADTNTNTLFEKLDSIKKSDENAEKQQKISGKCPCEEILITISDNVKVITQVLAKSNIWESDVAARKKTQTTDAVVKATEKIVEGKEEIAAGQSPAEKSDKVRITNVISSAFGNSRVLASLKNTLKRAFGSSEVQRIVEANQEEQNKLLAERRNKYGFTQGSGVTSTGDIARIQRRRALWGREGTNPFADIQLTPNKDVNTTAITGRLQSLIQRNMFSAQTGGVFRNLIGSMTGYIGMPSLEKTRSQIEALNTILEKIRSVVGTLLNDIQSKQGTLREYEKQGLAKFDNNGRLIEDKTTGQAATNLVAQIEEQKLALTGVLAEATMVDDVIKTTGEDAAKVVQELGFASPELRDCNIILQNINAGLDKSGKVLKHTTRTGEVLNYSLQLMARHVGQIWKNWMLMANPMTWIKRAFSDFTSYSVKWQRTMNVIKYNLRAAIRPMMEKIAQLIVNIIGLVNSLAKGLGIFGKDFDLFDQSAASAEKMREEMEAAANVSAGFDELHDIGSDNSAAGDLMGDIYTPQWEGLQNIFEHIGETIRNIFDFISGLNFWQWLAIAGAALVGFLALKWLISMFANRNPLESVANGFSFLEKAVGWALLIWAFTSFVKALTDFVECMKSANWSDIAKSLVMLGGSFLILVGALAGSLKIAKMFGTNFLDALGLAVIIAAFSLFVVSLTGFIEALSEISSEQLMSGLLFLIGAIGTITLAISALIAVLTLLGPVSVPVMAVLSLMIATFSLVILSLAEFVRALGENAEGVKVFFEGIAEVITAIGDAISEIFTSVGDIVIGVINAIADGVNTILTPIFDFILQMTETIGEVIATVIRAIGDVIIDIINTIIDGIGQLFDSIISFIEKLGPAISGFVDELIQSVTKLVNFVISAIEYLVNLVIDGVNGIISAVNGLSQYVGITIPRVPKFTIARFVPQYEQGTNYVPNDGLAYLHQGEAVIPKKYNQPYQQGLTAEERSYMQQMMITMRSLDDAMKQGITVNGEFTQRGSDLVAVVNKTKSQTGADLISNVAYAR